MTTSANADQATLLAVYRDIYRGMLERDTDLLDSLLSDTYTLTHMTGYMQSKMEWLQQIESGEMRYHSAQERSTTITVDADGAVVVGRSRVDATIWGNRDAWNLQLTTWCRRDGQSWLAVRTLATTF